MSTPLFVLLALVAASAFFLVGYFAVFKPQQLVAFYMRTGGERFARRLQEATEIEGYFRTLKASGVIALLTGVGIILLTFVPLIK
jgi:ABC-type spermidine/putrescine transport system permease subunit I